MEIIVGYRTIVDDTGENDLYYVDELSSDQEIYEFTDEIVEEVREDLESSVPEIVDEIVFILETNTQEILWSINNVEISFRENGYLSNG